MEVNKALLLLQHASCYSVYGVPYLMHLCSCLYDDNNNTLSYSACQQGLHALGAGFGGWAAS